jgi:hypothetical protein
MRSTDCNSSIGPLQASERLNMQVGEVLRTTEFEDPHCAFVGNVG